MSGPRLRLLGELTWDGVPVPGERTHTLLTALAAANGRAVRDDRLTAEIWGDEPPANPTKALQVVVSRARSATSAQVVARTDHGYRLALNTDDVDIWVRDQALIRARTAINDGDWATAESCLPVLRETAPLLAGRVLSALGRHDEALPLLADHGDDDAALVARLHSEAAVHGVPAALAQYETYREDLADRLGVDPSAQLREVHRELLARDRPVRSGVRADASGLIGRDHDVAILTAMLSSAKVVSIVGPGGLGKTRLAHLLGSRSGLPVVQFVELVGVTSPDDLVGEVGSILGVRDSLSGTRSLTPAQRADVRSRVAQQLEVAPTLLILDNCEHIVEAVADLVAFLAAVVPGLHVLTTTRAPLAISAERVYLLGQLEGTDAIELFVRRATAARPNATLPLETVDEIVTRLDGLPLAIELAAVKIRAMSAADIANRLSNRFALLRGGDRSAPDRHQTLLAVIDWSWNLLTERERRALRRLAVFHDGFTLDAAEAVIGDEAFESVAELVDQSLLTVVERADGVRYRMLETVREFGRMQLVDAGDDLDSIAAQRQWAVDLAGREARRLISPDQVAAVSALRREELNLSDILRQALAENDRQSAVTLVAALGGIWAISGDMPRVVVLVGSLTDAFSGWTPPPELADRTRFVLGLTLFGAGLVSSPEETARLRETLAELGTDTPHPRLRALLQALIGLADVTRAAEIIDDLTNDPNPLVRAVGLQFRCHERENAGEPLAAVEAGSQALALLEPYAAADGPWNTAMLRTQLAGLYAQFGDVDAAARLAEVAIPPLELLGNFDEVQLLRSMLAVAAIDAGDFAAAERMVEEATTVRHSGTLGSHVAALSSRAHLAIARGDIAGGLAYFRRAVDAAREVKFPGGGMGDQAPWVVVSEATALAAFARLGSGDEGRDLYDVQCERARIVLDGERPFLDFPVAGMMVFGIGAWALLRGTMPVRTALTLIAIADRFAYHRLAPALRWERIVEDAERIAPGVLTEVESELGDRRGRSLLATALDLIESNYIFRE
ncbi:ATP-binding protein [Smaragdicoccus niigatensis]|uniref:ATP-binding protein n=1 Tax=Smaragdicoccus niigatensis TaxID=359359 RepID=UPI0006885586|nr:AAA family ATPase [Smaragdicoccus niigatensis]